MTAYMLVNRKIANYANCAIAFLHDTAVYTYSLSPPTRCIIFGFTHQTDFIWFSLTENTLHKTWKSLIILWKMFPRVNLTDTIV